MSCRASPVAAKRAAQLKPTRTIRIRKRRRTKMMNRTVQRAIVAAFAVFLLAAMLAVTSVAAQQATGVPGSPSATTTVDGKQLPAPPPKFGAVIKESAKDSTPWWPPRVVPPKGAPHILLIMTDDQGDGAS